jgi:pyruvate formate lyase activating enzyme
MSPKTEKRTITESYLYERSEDRTRCGVCERRCNIPIGSSGFCHTRKNIDGRLYSIVYGDLSACESRPIEIKPFFHFHPGSSALTFSTWSCNFLCPWCQNFNLSKTEPPPERSNYKGPEELVRLALDHGDDGLCASFQEPTLLFEYLCDAFEHARERGLYNTVVSNGYLTVKALKMLKDSGLDAIKIDVKGDVDVYRKYCAVNKPDAVWRNVNVAKELGLHVEVVNLVITDLNDDEECLKDIIDKHLKFAGSDTPLHFTRYHPAYRLKNPPTSIEVLEYAYELAKERGVLFPYLGNVPFLEYENTYCPECNELLIRRHSFGLISCNLKRDHRCYNCSTSIPIVGPCHV